MKTKQFHLGDVLSVITGNLVSLRHVDGLYDILGFMIDAPGLMTHQIPSASLICEPVLKQRYPELVCPEMDLAVKDLLRKLVPVDYTDNAKGRKSALKILKQWLSDMMKGKYGVACSEYYEVEALEKSECKMKDPVAEACEMVGSDKLIFASR